MRHGAMLRFAGAVVLCCAALALGACALFQPQPAVDFQWTPTGGTKPLLVDFTPIVGEGAKMYSWDFGDGARSTEAAPSHVYYAAGTYSVSLAVTYEGGRVGSASKSGCITVTAISAKEYVLNLYVLSASEGVIRCANLDTGMVAEPNPTPPTLQTLQTGIQPGEAGRYPLAAAHGTGERFVYWWAGGVVYYKAVVSGSVHYLGLPDAYEMAGLCADSVNQKLYWTFLPPLYGGSIDRSDLDGNNAEVISRNWSSGTAVPWFVSVDPSADRLYFVRMYYVAPDGGGDGGEPLAVQPKATAPTSIDVMNPLDPNSRQTLVSDIGEVGGMAVDAGLSAGARYIYWTVPGAGRIDRCKVDGSEVTQLITGLTSPKAIVVDVGRGKLYWAEPDGVHRANLDGTGAELIFPGVTADALAIG